MKWFWVSRANAERYEAYLEGCIQRERDLLFAERSAHDVTRQRCEALTERLLSLKMTGATEPPKLQAIAAAVEKDQEKYANEMELRDLIDVQCGGNLQKRRMMLRQLAADLAVGTDPEKIAQQIVAGVSSDGVPS